MVSRFRLMGLIFMFCFIACINAIPAQASSDVLTLNTPQSISVDRTVAISGNLSSGGTGISGASISITCTGGTVSASTVTTASNGNFTVNFTANNVAGTDTVTASYVVDSSTTLTQTINVTVNPPITLTSSEYLLTNTPMYSSAGYNYYLPQPVSLSSISTISFYYAPMHGSVSYIYDDQGHYYTFTPNSNDYDTFTEATLASAGLVDINYLYLYQGGTFENVVLSVGPPPSFSISVSTDPTTFYPDISFEIPPSATSAYLYKNNELLTSLPVTATSYEDSSVSGDVTPQYYILAANSLGQTVSNIVTFNPPAPGNPQLSGTDNSGSIELSWSSVPYCTTIKVFQNNALLATLSGSTTSYTTNQSPTGTYIYYVQALNQYTYSASNIIVLPQNKLNSQNSLYANVFNNSLNLSWVPTPGATQYNVLVNGSLVSTLPSTDQSYQFVPSASGKYNIYIQAVTSSGYSASNIVSIDNISSTDYNNFTFIAYNDDRSGFIGYYKGVFTKLLNRSRQNILMLPPNVVECTSSSAAN